jgi:hypothetical protein
MRAVGPNASTLFRRIAALVARASHGRLVSRVVGFRPKTQLVQQLEQTIKSRIQNLGVRIQQGYAGVNDQIQWSVLASLLWKFV